MGLSGGGGPRIRWGACTRRNTTLLAKELTPILNADDYILSGCGARHHEKMPKNESTKVIYS